MKRKIIIGAASLLVLAAAFFLWKFFGPTLPSEQEGKYLYIKTGSTFKDVQSELVKNHFAKSSFWFKTVARMAGYRNVKPGRYKVTSRMSLMNLVRMLKNGSQTPVSFVITKIRTKEGLASRIGSNFECNSDEMLGFMNNQDSLQAFSLDTNTAMIAALPLTYEIKWNTTPGKIFRQFYAAYTSFWTEERKRKAEKLHLTPAEVSILASIIDEETTKAVDRPNIASVYINRIDKGISLQADPTIKFAMKDFGLKRIYEKYLTFESPYNTYVNKGLPPGPICTPSTETLKEVINAPKTDFIYFVADSDLDGRSVFTSNYKDHMKYAKLYQQALNKQDSIKKARESMQ